MRIVIDLQGAQSSGSRYRGIGRYTMSLAQAIVRNKGEHEVILALNGLFADSIEPIRAAFQGLLSQANIRVWQVPGPVGHMDTNNDWRRQSAELVREAFLASLNPDVVLVSSLMEGLGDDIVTSVGLLSNTVPTAVILYDLIPLINPHLYFQNPVVEKWFENKYGNIRRAGLLLAISESSRQEAINYLGFPTDMAVNISTAAESQFQPIVVSAEKEKDVRQRHNLQRQFVMYTGGIDFRKNIDGLIRAYAKLPKRIRAKTQLAIVCSIQQHNRDELLALAKQHGLAADELVLTGFVSEDDLLALYNLCQVFVFPSWHEGFGLPALEAMSCGRAVIAANTSSLPEVIGRDDALFDPRSDESIASKLEQVLTDGQFRRQLELHGLEQSRRFSWDASGKAAIAAFCSWQKKEGALRSVAVSTNRRPKLAYFSPLPPERSGISGYSAELLPELARHYDVDVIVAQDSIADPWISANCTQRSIEWFKVNSSRYERVLYHFGNSHFHEHMLNLLESYPGVVVLHDFFLSGMTQCMDVHGVRPSALVKELSHAHGYAAVQRRFHISDVEEAVLWQYPCNLSVLQSALGVIVHSNHSKQLAKKWYGEGAGDDWSVLPLLRMPPKDIGRNEARRALNLDPDDFVICSFGILAPTKLNHRLLKAWLSSALSRDYKCVLVFVGQNHGGDYGVQLLEVIAGSGVQKNIRITGWTDDAAFRQYLAAADVGVQLRTLSRGETSASVLDCMNWGMPTIVNANGSMADLPEEAVWKLPDEFEDEQLVEALEKLWKDASLRKRLGENARRIVRTYHAPRTCADQYAEVIERTYREAATGVGALTHALGVVEPAPNDADSWGELATAVERSISPKIGLRQLLVDVSSLIEEKDQSETSDVARSLLRELFANPPHGYRVDPVYATSDKGYRYARQFALRFLNCPDSVLTDDPIEFRAGDQFVGLAVQQQVVLTHDSFYQTMRNHGVQVNFVVYDMLPVLQPQRFVPGAADQFQEFLQVIMRCDGVLCPSRTVADEMLDSLSVGALSRLRPFNVGCFQLGVDVDWPVKTDAAPADVDASMRAIAAKPSFLILGELASGRGHSQVLEAFEGLWARGVEINLVIVGKAAPTAEKLAETIRSHSSFNCRLFWLENVDGSHIQKVYEKSACLIAASEREGFDRSLVEAVRYKLPVIARDIPLFRELTGEQAVYFSGRSPEALADSVQAWLAVGKAGHVRRLSATPWLSWKQSAKNLMDVVLDGQWYQEWMPDDVQRFWGSDKRLLTQVGLRSGRTVRSTGQSGYLIFGPYIALAAGEYRVVIHGSAGRDNLAGAKFDVSVNQAALILGESVLGEPDRDGVLVTETITLDAACDDLEVRVWVGDHSDVTISLLEIHPFPVVDQGHSDISVPVRESHRAALHSGRTGKPVAATKHADTKIQSIGASEHKKRHQIKNIFY
ncbi:Glycosyltransferase involved in cell wall bisynthesis [Burkholderia sp. GAS332]|nr:Glycosyltransferase involved in cell wall bisynthesis [Burkholderia sp. GAS332]